MIPTQTLIIGAGPAGLATAGRLRKMGLDFILLEQEREAAPAWRRHYDRLCLHTVKELSALPHLPFPKEYPLYVPKKAVLDYFEQYCRELDLHPLFGRQVVEVWQQEGQWHTRTANGEEYVSENVVVCTGFNRKPHIPAFDGQADFRGKILHSSEYRNPAEFQGKKVLVVGMGNSGAEIALDLCERGVQTAISIRGKVNIVPRDTLGRPTQRTAILLSKLPLWLGDALGRMLRRLTIGNLKRYGIEMPDMAPGCQLRTMGKTPMIDIGTLARIKKGEIAVKSGPERFTADGVRFVNGQEEPFDAVILATGYRSALADFLEGAGELFNAAGHPIRAVSPAPFDGLHFVGFNGYSSGILRSIYKDSGKVAGHIYQRWKDAQPQPLPAAAAGLD